MVRQGLYFPTPGALRADAGDDDMLSDRLASPLYVQLEMLLRDKIDARAWRNGEAIPSEAELCERYGVSRGTVRRAIQMLVQEGYLITKKGSGSFVSEGGIPRPATRSPLSFAVLLRERGMDFSTRVLSREVMGAPQAVAAHLGVGQGSPTLFMRRVRSVAGAPMVCQESWSNLAACPGLEDSDFERESLFDAVERCSCCAIGDSTVHYSSRPAGEEHAALLACGSSDPTLVLEQDIRLDNGTTIEWSLTWLRPGTSVVAESLQDQLASGHLETSREASVDRARDERRALRRRLERGALEVRRGVIEIAHRYQGSPFHIGGALSLAEISSVLFGCILRTGKDATPWDERDRFVLSKAHASVALYPAMLKAGLISKDDLDKGLFGPDAVLFKHPRRDPTRGIEMSGGSLGMGLGYATGLALALRRRHKDSRVFCIVGDGECDEGAVWESAGLAGFMRLSSLCVIVDANGMQLDGPTSQVFDNGPIQRKFASFGFEVAEVDGHDVLALVDALSVRSERPRAVVARTVKGKGLSFAENNVTWHDNALSEEIYRQAVRELAALERGA